jgi:hypothetical protein
MSRNQAPATPLLPTRRAFEPVRYSPLCLACAYLQVVPGRRRRVTVRPAAMPSQAAQMRRSTAS